MNIQLDGTEEYIDGKSSGSLGQVLIRCVGSFPPLFFAPWGGVEMPGGCFMERERIENTKEGGRLSGKPEADLFFSSSDTDRKFFRCNNVLWISAAPKPEGDRGDVKMEG